MTSHPIGNSTVNAMASNAGFQNKNCAKNWCLNLLMTRSRLASSLFATPLLCLAGLMVLSCLLGVAPAALAQTAPYLNANGWTVFTPTTGTGSCGNSSSNYTGTCVVFVSSSTGNDSTCAAQLPSVTIPSAGQACATITKGLSLLRSPSADWLLLKNGDTFAGQDFNGSGGQFCYLGTSSTQPLLIGTYGTGARPLVEVPGTDLTGAAMNIAECSGGTGGDKVAIVGIEFYAYTRDPSNASYRLPSSDLNGIYDLETVSSMLIENCKFSFFTMNIYIDEVLLSGNTPGANLTIRRNVIVNAYSTTSTGADGMLIDGINNLLIQENVIDSNGWNATIAGTGANALNHNLYLQCDIDGGNKCNSNVTVIGNIISNDASGSQFRSGGTITNNAFIRNPYGHNIGQPWSGVQTLVNNNVHIEQIDNTVNGGTGDSIDTINTFSSYNGNSYNRGTATYSGNIIVHSGTPDSGGGGINIDPGQVGSVVENNIACNWIQDGGAPSGALIWNQSSSSTLTGNYQDVADCNHNNYPSPDLTVGTYDTSLNTGSCNGNTVGTTANFICKARQQSEANWSNALMAAAFNAYIQAGFGITSSSSTSSSSTSSSSTSSSSTSSSSTSSSSTSSSSTSSSSANTSSASAGLVAAVLPESRSAQVGGTVTAFATIINTGTTAGAGCSISPATSLAVTFVYQTTNPTTNALTGTANTPVSIAGNNGSQSFVVALTPSAAFAPTNVAFNFSCSNVAPAPVVTGLNTVLLSASTTPTPDVVALAATMQNDGIVHVTGTPSEGEFAVATDNLGSGDTITIAANTGAATLPVAITLCQTNPQSGQCLQTPSATVTTTINSNATPTFGVFVSASGAVALNPANSRIFVTFTDSTNAVRGETSVAVETQ